MGSAGKMPGVSPARTTAAIARLGSRCWAGIRRHPFLVASTLPVLALVAAAVSAAMYVASLIPLTPNVEHVVKARSDQPAVVLTADGQQLAVFRRANRQWVKLADISPHVVDALIATEDRKFFDHRGVDVRRTLAAAYHTLRGDLQGGSTITQQLARNLYPDEVGRAPTLARKVKEAITALKIEKVYDKNEILETYLNTVPFLYNAHGIEVAARTYFDKPARELDVLESATLIGMLKGTSYYNPVLNPERARQRRNTVMAQMVRAGKLDPAVFESLKARPLGLDFEVQAEPAGPAPHVARQLRRWLIDWADRNGYDLYADGLVVRTTIDSRLQEMADEAVRRQADKLQALANAAWGRPGWAANRELLQTFLRETAQYRKQRESGLADGPALRKLMADAELTRTLWQTKTRLQSGFLALNPNDGHVLAWVGSRDFEEEQFDHVAQARRQPGSTFKPFVYGAAFEQGIAPTEMFIDQPVEIQVDARTVWRPTDVDAPSGRAMTLREGLVYSKNTITAQLVQQIGPERVAQLAQAMGVRQSKLDAVPSLALGTSPVTLKEMVSAFGTIANGGNYIEPVLVTRIEDRQHHVLQEFHPQPEPALSNAADQILLDAMRGVIDEGTGVGIRRRFGIRADVAGKTGTTQDNTDGWFILMHPQLVAGAWVGFDDNRITMRGDWGQGAHNALNIVGDFFQQSLKAKLIDANSRFAVPPHQSMFDPLFARANDWFGGVYAPDSQPLAPRPGLPEVVAMPSQAQSQPVFEVPLVVEPPPAPPVQRDPLPDVTVHPPPLAAPEVPRPQVRGPVRVESLPHIVITPGGVIPQRPRQPGQVLAVPAQPAVAEPPAISRRFGAAQELGSAIAMDPYRVQ